MKNVKLQYYLLPLFVFLISFTFTSCKSNKSMIDKSVVKELNIDKYLGTWYEIARFDHRFERKLQGVQANYSMRKDGKIKVVNSGYKGGLNGKYKSVTGKAKIPDPVNEPARLKVSFFWFFYGDYYVMELDKDYQWAVIGSSSDDFLWILSRKPQLKQEVLNDLISRIKKRGYDTSKLQMVEQKL